MKQERLQNQLITRELKARFNEIGRQNSEDSIIIAKFFNPCGAATWYLTEYAEGNNTGFGYVTGFDVDEWGSVSITELEALRCPPLGLPIERDLYFDECPFSKLKL